MKITVLSDTHGHHRKLKIPKCDLILFAGDITNVGEINIITDFNAWLGELNTPSICIAGNHDMSLWGHYHLAKQLLTNTIYLENELVSFDGLKIYGSPVAKRIGHWAFGYNSAEEAKKYWAKIPHGTDVVMTHSPVFGILDRGGSKMENLGCPFLLEAVKKLKPKLMIGGHVHESYGDVTVDGIRYINASICDFPNYEPLRKPILTEI